MAAQNPNGEQKYWFNGLPFEGVLKSGNDEGTQKYWFNGLPGEFLYPSGSPPTTVIKDIIGMGFIPFLR